VRTIVVATVILHCLVVSVAESRAEVIHVGISTPGLYEIPTEIAQRKAFYKAEGLDARKVVIRTGLHVAALLAGNWTTRR
jgi:hypothetical protein